MLLPLMVCVFCDVVYTAPLSMVRLSPVSWLLLAKVKLYSVITYPVGAVSVYVDVPADPVIICTLLPSQFMLLGSPLPNSSCGVAVLFHVLFQAWFAEPFL